MMENISSITEESSPVHLNATSTKVVYKTSAYCGGDNINLSRFLPFSRYILNLMDTENY